MTVTVTKLNQSRRYEAPNHRDVEAVRLQGLDAGGATAFWVGHSRILPGGGAGPDSGALEKVYVILSGQVTLRTSNQTIVLGRMDSVCIPAQVEREIKNETSEDASMLVVMPTPPRE